MRGYFCGTFIEEFMRKTGVFIFLLAVCGNAYGEVAADSVVKEPTALSEIVVKADRYIRTSSGMIVTPGRQQVRHSSSGYDLLRNLMIPGVSVDVAAGKVEALGGSVSLYIDGLPADIREVRQLRPGDVAQVQYFDAPTGKYAGDNVAINFVLKKRDSGGYVSVDALQRFGYANGDYNIGAKIYRGNTQYTLFAGADYKSIHGAATTRHDEILFPAADVTRDYSTENSGSKKNSQYAMLRVRNKTDRRTLRATFNFVRDATPTDYDLSELVYGGLSVAPITIGTHRNSDACNLKYSLGLSGTFNFSRSRFMYISASASVARNHYSYAYGEDDRMVMSATGEDYYSFTANAAYGFRFSHGNSLTFKMSELHNVSSANYTGSHSSWQHLWSSETILFGEYAPPLWEKASVRVAPGFSAQYYRLHGKALTSFIGPRLQAVFAMQPVRNQFFQIQLYYGNSYPQLSLMTEAVRQVDLIEERRGNPDLKQTKIAQATAAYGIGIGKVNLQAVVICNGAKRLPVVGYYFDGDKLVQSYLPYGDWRQLDSYLSVTWLPSAKLNIQLSGGYYYNGYFNEAHVSGACWKANGLMAYYFGDFACNLLFETPRKVAGYDLTVTRTPWKYGLSLSWSRDALRIEAGADNLFSRRPVYRQMLNTPIYGFEKSMYSPADRRAAYVKVSWSLDFGKKTKHETPDVDRTIGSGILRAH